MRRTRGESSSTSRVESHRRRSLLTEVINSTMVVTSKDTRTKDSTDTLVVSNNSITDSNSNMDSNKVATSWSRLSRSTCPGSFGPCENTAVRSCELHLGRLLHIFLLDRI